jgi:hypothetical protein
MHCQIFQSCIFDLPQPRFNKFPDVLTYSSHWYFFFFQFFVFSLLFFFWFFLFIWGPRINNNCWPWEVLVSGWMGKLWRWICVFCVQEALYWMNRSSVFGSSWLMKAPHFLPLFVSFYWRANVGINVV